MLRFRTSWWFLLGALAACQPPDMPTLEVTASPRTIDGRGGTSTISVSAWRRDMVPGSGSVRLSSTAGTFKTPVTVALDANGKANESFTCVAADEPACVPRVTITADWLHGGVAFTAEARITVNAPGGGSAGGAAAGGASGGGSAGGSAGGGSAGGGSTGGGSTGGGSTGGGSTAGGSTAGGSAAGGSAAGGSAGGGSAGGSAGGGGAGGGTAGGSAGGSAGGTAGGAGDGGTGLRFATTVIDPRAVNLWGQLTRNGCEGAFAPLDGGSRPFVGTPCNLNPQLAFLTPDGGFVYRHPVSGQVLQAMPDALAPGTGGWRYPMNVEGNDVDLTPACTGAPNRFLVRPSNGSVVAQCADNTWKEGTTTLTHLGTEQVIAFGLNDSALVNRAGNLFLISPAGVETAVASPFVPETKLTRATANGFYAVANAAPPACALYELRNDGTVTKLGDYTTMSSIPSVPTPCNGRIDATGTLFYGYTTVSASVIARRPLTGTITYAYPATTTSTIWSFTPIFNITLNDGHGIVTSP